jgi:hypothetical protein
MTQPVGEHVGGAIVEQIDRSVRLEIDEQRAVAALLPAQGHVVHTQYPRTTLVVGIGERMQDPQERVRANGHASLSCPSSATLAARLQRERRQQIGGAVGPTRIASQCAIEALGKDLARASRHVAEPATAVDAQMDHLATPR